MKSTKLLLLFIALIVSIYSLAQGDYITRGWNSGEITLFSYWYWEDDYHDYQAVLRSNDYGESLEIIHYYNMYDPNLNTPIANIYSDLTPGIIYSFTVTKLSISYDYGFNWNDLNVPGPYGNLTAGNGFNTMYYAFWDPYTPHLFKSVDLGQSFLSLNTNIMGKPRVGNQPEVLLSNALNQDMDTLNINISNDSGYNFIQHTQIPFPDCGATPWGRYPNIYRGAQGEELYIVTWHYSSIGETYFNISFSSDYGKTYTLQYSSPYFHPMQEFFHFTGGVQSGEFYYVLEIQDYSLGYFATTLKIYSSLDSAQTFNEYIHVLDSGFPVSIDEYSKKSIFVNEVQAFPNPVSEKINVSFLLNKNSEITYLLFNNSGKAVIPEKKKLFQKGENTLDINLTGLKPGIYYLRLSSGFANVEVCKIIKK